MRSQSNTTGGNNTANGHHALFANTTGINNTASGSSRALCTTPRVAATSRLGFKAGVNLTTGSNNIDIG